MTNILNISYKVIDITKQDERYNKINKIYIKIQLFLFKLYKRKRGKTFEKYIIIIIKCTYIGKFIFNKNVVPHSIIFVK